MTGTMRALGVLLAILPLAAGVAAGLAPEARRDPGEFPWVDQPTHRADEARSGYVPGARVPLYVEEAWRIPGFNPGSHTASKGSAVAVDGILYIGSDDGTLHALRASDGTTVWTAQTGPSRNGIHGTPAVHGDLVLVGAYDGLLYAFDRATGAQVWATEVGDYIGSSPLVWGDRIYVAAETDRPSGTMVMLDLDGTILAADPGLMSHPHSPPGLDAGLGILAVGDNTGNLTAWDLDLNRRFVFNVRPDGEGPNEIKGPIAMANGSAYFGSWDRHIYRVDLTTGQPVWARKVPGYVMSGAAIGPDGTVYIGSHDHHLYALGGDDGRLLWSVRTGGGIYGSPTLADGKVLVGSHDGWLHCLDAKDGHAVWTHWVGGYVTGSPVVAGDGIVVAARRSGDRSGDLVMVRAA